MKKFLLLLATLPLIMCACGSDEVELTEEERLTQLQDGAFANVQNNIVGDWHKAQFYNDGSYSDYWNKPIGWLDVTSQEVYYSFKTDGSFTEGSLSGTYKLYKNTTYLKIPNFTVPTYIELDYHNGISATKRGITIEGGYLRIYSISNLYGTEYASFDGYPANYKYSKN